MDLRLQRKELLPSPVQFLCPSGLINGWSDWLDKEIEDSETSLHSSTLFDARALKPTVTLEDVERLFLLPSMGRLDLMDLELDK